MQWMLNGQMMRNLSADLDWTYSDGYRAEGKVAEKEF